MIYWVSQGKGSPELAVKDLGFRAGRFKVIIITQLYLDS